MAKPKLKTNQLKTIIFCAYLFGVPALYLVLTNWRKDKLAGEEGGRAFMLWVWLFLFFFAFRFLAILAGSLLHFSSLNRLEFPLGAFLWGYAVFRGFQSLFVFKK